MLLNGCEKLSEKCKEPGRLQKGILTFESYLNQLAYLLRPFEFLAAFNGTADKEQMAH